MQVAIRDAADHLLALLEARPEQRILCGIFGVPGSGKSEFATAVEDELNRRWKGKGRERDVAIAVGMDGWHYTREVVSEQPVS
jgi:pantothenate kinase